MSWDEDELPEPEPMPPCPEDWDDTPAKEQGNYDED